jgi:hypothetical protein
MSKIDELAAVARELPPEAVDSLLILAHAWKQSTGKRPRYVPVRLGGLWEGVEITEQDIAEARREIWGKLGDT